MKLLKKLWQTLKCWGPAGGAPATAAIREPQAPFTLSVPGRVWAKGGFSWVLNNNEPPLQMHALPSEQCVCPTCGQLCPPEALQELRQQDPPQEPKRQESRAPVVPEQTEAETPRVQLPGLPLPAPAGQSLLPPEPVRYTEPDGTRVLLYPTIEWPDSGP